MKITVVKDYKGNEEVHKAGCADLKRRNRPYRLAEALTMDAETLADLYAVYWECIDEENVYDGSPYSSLEEVWWAWRSEFTVKPCAAGLPEMAEPGTEKVQDQGSQAVPASGIVGGNGPDVPAEGERREMMDSKTMTTAEVTAHLRAWMRKPMDEFNGHLREEHGYDGPELSNRSAAASTHAKLLADAVPSESADEIAAKRLLAGVTRNPDEEPPVGKPAPRTRKAKADAPAKADAEPATKTPPARRTRKLAAVPDAPATPEPAKPVTRSRKATAPATETPKPATRTRKATATAPATETPKPATRGRKAAETAPPKADANGSGTLSRSEAKRALAREVVTLVTERFAGLSDAEKADIAYWLHWCPTGDLWWPANGFPEPVTDGWIRGKARIAERDKAK